MKLEYKEVVINPAEYFSKPGEIVDSSDFTNIEKRKILKAWRLDIILLHMSDEENMCNGKEVEMLSRICRALNEVPLKSNQVRQ